MNCPPRYFVRAGFVSSPPILPSFLRPLLSPFYHFPPPLFSLFLLPPLFFYPPFSLPPLSRLLIPFFPLSPPPPSHSPPFTISSHYSPPSPHPFYRSSSTHLPSLARPLPPFPPSSPYFLPSPHPCFSILPPFPKRKVPFSPVHRP